ncbi:MAG: ATP-binding cassette domain-containing protein, partial [Caldilineaceae bacterium]|nr:ATP-binding cassette domain-containing protein [Caldilineaceae bacterium]
GLDGGLDGDAWADQRRSAAVTDLTMEILPNATTALVGGTGAGKSTVANLLLGFVAPDRGHIHLGEQPLATMDCAAWRAQIAWVPQRPHLFHGSISDNIRLARPTADREAVMAAARAAHAHEFILRLPQGYATPVGQNGARLSMGQRQRIAIARAFLKDAPLLVLDEFTAHLDAATEAQIRLAIRRLMTDRTVLLIAHRMQLVTDAQQIIVMDQGRAVEVGTHARLLAQGGLYTTLFTTHATSAQRPSQSKVEAQP